MTFPHHPPTFPSLSISFPRPSLALHPPAPLAVQEYIHQPDTPPSLDCGSVVSILISADFLQMDHLVSLCLEFVHAHASEALAAAPKVAGWAGPRLAIGGLVGGRLLRPGGSPRPGGAMEPRSLLPAASATRPSQSRPVHCI